MAQNGGARPGAGRPKGSKLLNKTRVLAEKYAEEGVMPLEILVGDMRFYHKLAEAEMQLSKSLYGDEAAAHEKVGHNYKALAKEYAKEAAPYFHPRLASTQANINITNHEAALTELE